jgi:hypothetical protein
MERSAIRDCWLREPRNPLRSLQATSLRFIGRSCIQANELQCSATFCTTGAESMPKFTILSRKDAFVDYLAEVEAETPEAAVSLVYDGKLEVEWEEHGVVEFDAVHMVALDDNGLEIESTARGKF